MRAYYQKDGMLKPLNHVRVDGGAPELFPHAGIPDYVKKEASSVASRVAALQTDRTITFLAIADSHHLGAQPDGWQEKTNTANRHAAMAAKILAYAIPLDFVAYLGDATFGHARTDKPMLISQCEEMNRFISEGYKGIPNFRTVGNHDTGEYRYASTGLKDDLTGAPELYRLFGAFCDGADYGSTEFGYCYRDFPDKKLRVICLNSCEGETIMGESASYIMSQDQLLWFAQTLQSMSKKPDAAEWGIVTLAHYPLDYGGTNPAGHIIRMYVEGGSVTHKGTTVDFAGKNAAKYMMHFHGHTHCFKTSKMYDFDTGSPVQFDAWRMACPNSGFYRQNQYYGHPVLGVEFGEEQTYDKVSGTADDTAFVVNVIDPEKQVMHSICYGAGYDRTVGFAATRYFSIQTQLTNATLDNAVHSVEEGQPYTANVVLKDLYEIQTASVLMGGADITSSAYANGKISIPAVTGDVSIKVVAIKPASYTNVVPASIDSSGNVYEGSGYKNNTYLGSDGIPGTLNQFTTTGFIPVDGLPHTYRLAGSAAKNYREYGTRIAFYDADFHIVGSAYPGDKIGTTVYQGEVITEPSIAWGWKTNTNMNPSNKGKYIRFSCRTENDGPGLIITIDEPID